MKTLLLQISFVICFIFIGQTALAEKPKVAYDIDTAKEICNDLPLESVEGIWVYPDDKVTVLILNDNEKDIVSVLPSYTISVVETSDARLHPGDIIGKLKATPSKDVFQIELATEKKNDILLKPKTVTATLGKDGDTFIFKRGQTGLRGRLNINLNRLLPGFWKIVSLGISTNSGSRSVEPPVGMVKISPSYDGNGSSRRKVRYL